jgi:hypothetical protein
VPSASSTPIRGGHPLHRFLVRVRRYQFCLPPTRAIVAPESASVYPSPAVIFLRCETSYTNSMMPQMGVITAKLGHGDTRMTEKHYAHLAPSYVAQTIRANFPGLGLAGGAEVVPLRRAKKA